MQAFNNLQALQSLQSLQSSNAASSTGDIETMAMLRYAPYILAGLGIAIVSIFVIYEIYINRVAIRTCVSGPVVCVTGSSLSSKFSSSPSSSQSSSSPSILNPKSLIGLPNLSLLNVFKK